MNIQPVLTPCNRSNADLHVYLPEGEDMMEIYWGTSLLQRVPWDTSSFFARIMAGVLVNLGFPLVQLEECFPVCDKTLRKWGKALKAKTAEQMQALLSGHKERHRLSLEHQQYVQMRYDELKNNTANYRDQICDELLRYWGVEVSGELLRPLFREMDGMESAGKNQPEPNSGSADCHLHTEPSSEEPDTIVEVADVSVDSEPTRNNVCAEKLKIDSSENQPRNDCSVPATLPARAPIDTHVLHRRCPRVYFSHHAGLFSLLPWLQEGFGDADAMIQQFALQTLAGAANWEQSRQLDFDGLRLLCPSICRTPRVQSQWFKENAFSQTIEKVFRNNAELINMTAGRIFYFDPHTEKYTGKFKTLLGWCGSIHGVDKALHLDFIHTERGEPCYVRHFDNYEDLRQRFLVIREQFRVLFPGSPVITWVADRGIWSLQFLQKLAALHDTFATWEKGYKKGEWKLTDVVAQGKFTKWRVRNHSGDRCKYRFRWYEQPWEKVEGGRRIIVEATNPAGRCIEVSIVTNASLLSAEKIVWLMFNRWVQENDFAYLRQHFGIGELTERGFDYYSEIAEELRDRCQESRQYKRTRSRKKQQEKELSEKLMKMRPLQGLPTLEELSRREEKLNKEIERLNVELNNIRTDPKHKQSSGIVDRVQEKVNDLKHRFKQNNTRRQQAEQRDRLEAEAQAIEHNIEELQKELRSIPRTESRIQKLIDEEYVRLRMRSKPLADAVRITARNVFIQPLRIFRGIWQNRRNDHVVLRAITRSAGLVIPHSDKLEIVLYPQLDLQPAEWCKVYRLLEICEQRIREMQYRHDAPRITFTLCTSNKEMMSRLPWQG